MRYSNLFGKTVKKVSADIKTASHELLIKGGFIRESTAGRYYYLPLGIKVRNRVINVIREEMDKAGAQEMLTPVLHPIELWKQTNRTESVGFELTTLKDRHGTKFVLGGTAEEMFVEIVKQFNLSYKDLPFNVYQFSSKFRDELRVRGGLLRAREFTMKDAYSFDRDSKEFQHTYELMKKTYSQIFSRLGLKTVIVESDNGYIGGDYCHEFVVESEVGESKFLVSKNGDYAAHEDVARFKREDKNQAATLKPYKEVKAVRGNTMEDGVKLHQLPLWQQLKDVMYVTEKEEMILAVIRGDLTVNEVKLAKVVKAYTLRKATDEEIKTIGSVAGFISPVGLKGKVRIVGDLSLRTIKNAYGGANKKQVDAQNINLGRDYSLDIEADIALAKEGYFTEDGRQKLIAKRGIEVGNIFQLGYHYSKLMNAAFTDQDGKKKLYYMGCYGIGIDRTIAAIVEKYHDGGGIIWPENSAPFKVVLVCLNSEVSEVKEKAEEIYEKLQRQKVEVLYDDRQTVSPGEKLVDADLIGIPYRVVVSQKTLRRGQVEFKKRSDRAAILVDEKELIKTLG